MVIKIQGRFPFNPKFREISGGTSNGTNRFGLVRPGYSGPALKLVHFDRSGRSDRNVPFHFDKIVVPSTALLYLAYRNNNQTRGGLGQVCATGIPFHWAREISKISNRNFGLMLRPGIAFTICTDQFHLPKNGQETPKLVSTTLKMEHKFPCGAFRSEKQGHLFRCSFAPGNFPPGMIQKGVFHLLPNRIFRKLFENGKQPRSRRE